MSSKCPHKLTTLTRLPDTRTTEGPDEDEEYPGETDLVKTLPLRNFSMGFNPRAVYGFCCRAFVCRRACSKTALLAIFTWVKEWNFASLTPHLGLAGPDRPASCAKNDRGNFSIVRLSAPEELSAKLSIPLAVRRATEADVPNRGGVVRTFFGFVAYEFLRNRRPCHATHNSAQFRVNSVGIKA